MSNKLPEKYKKAFFEAQQEVTIALRPYMPRCIDQVFGNTGAIESFAVHSKEPDIGDDRHRWRGIITVHYNYPIAREDRCSVCFSFSEDMIAHVLGLQARASWEATAALIERLIPALPPEKKEDAA